MHLLQQLCQRVRDKWKYTVNEREIMCKKWDEWQDTKEGRKDLIIGRIKTTGEKDRAEEPQRSAEDEDEKGTW